MKLLASVAFGAAALATSLVAAEPAAARTSFGVYVGPGYYGDGYRYRDYRYRCDDYWYRRNHPRRCGYYDYDDDYGYYDNDYYYPGFGFSFDGGRRHHGRWGHHGHHHHHHW